MIRKDQNQEFEEEFIKRGGMNQNLDLSGTSLPTFSQISLCDESGIRIHRFIYI